MGRDNKNNNILKYLLIVGNNLSCISANIENVCALLDVSIKVWIYGRGFLNDWYRISLPGVKRPGHEVDHSSPSSAKVKNEWSCTASRSISLHDVDRDSFLNIVQGNGYLFSLIFSQNSKFHFNLTLYVPCIILQCVYDQQGAQFL